MPTMVTQAQWEEVPNVEEQTPLPNGDIKIPWQSRDRARVRRGLTAALADGWIERGIAAPCMGRQETQVVIKTEEELEAFQAELDSRGIKWRVYDRIQDEINSQYEGEGKANKSKKEKLSGQALTRKEETDMEVLLNDVVIPHARRKCEEVWPGGTVDVDEISWFWNPQLTSCAGKAYWRGAEPSDRYDISSPAIGLSPYSYYVHGIDELLSTVRHELIHIWQCKHENGFSRGGHAKDFKQWIGDMDTGRYCQHF